MDESSHLGRFAAVLGRLNWASLAICMLGGLLLVFAGGEAWELADLYRLRRSGETTTGEVIHAGRRKSSSRSASSTTYWIEYRFEAGEEGGTRTGRSEVTVAFEPWEAAKPGGSVQVMFLPHAPEVNAWDRAVQHKPAELWGTAGGIGALGLLLFIAGLVTISLTREQFERWWYWD